ncbi:SDR family NAD(P)-dependent oxidoreductase [Mycobacterium sp. 1274756.6]|uniref:SDR family NAD(P)-dependent oxidoreductase n=1 Tax=Mycobacterium sp. 1274756.6 TaxID=1834076 RepID=UPI0007FDE94C|nr:SDR family NAD(P)-dependent oxidoreductase [Mycobacterium sp. 1274756.6]OBJ73820.1 oxidoreductase [Mycobacterium sp. 1274756.6]
MGLALITGASSGIGAELATQFARHGYDLVIAAEDDGIHAAAERLAETATDVVPVQVDLRTRAGVEELYRRATEGGRSLDAAALNAGVASSPDFVHSDLEDDLSVIDLNVRGTVVLAKLILRDMARRDTGKLLFTSSIVAMMPGSYQAIYGASKAFIQSLAAALQDELRNTGVTVTSLMPGPTDTDFFRRAGMENTLLSRHRTEDPAAVAEQGFHALMRGDRQVVAASPITKLTGIVLRLLPDPVKAAMDRVGARPRR